MPYKFIYYFDRGWW